MLSAFVHVPELHCSAVVRYLYEFCLN